MLSICDFLYTSAKRVHAVNMPKVGAIGPKVGMHV